MRLLPIESGLVPDHSGRKTSVLTCLPKTSLRRSIPRRDPRRVSGPLGREVVRDWPLACTATHLMPSRPQDALRSVETLRAERTRRRMDKRTRFGYLGSNSTTAKGLGLAQRWMLLLLTTPRVSQPIAENAHTTFFVEWCGGVYACVRGSEEEEDWRVVSACVEAGGRAGGRNALTSKRPRWYTFRVLALATGYPEK